VLKFKRLKVEVLLDYYSAMVIQITLYNITL